jgi:hypothetical protein
VVKGILEGRPLKLPLFKQSLRALSGQRSGGEREILEGRPPQTPPFQTVLAICGEREILEGRPLKLPLSNDPWWKGDS